MSRCQFHDWENLAINQRNRLPIHTPMVPYNNIDHALKNISPYIISLDGIWKFAYYLTPEDVPLSVFTQDYSDDNWPSIPVPSSWQQQGFGVPHYFDTYYGFDPDPPHVPKENPTGIYRRRFSLPLTWNNRRTRIVFEGADSSLTFWINGKEAGYSEDSRLDAEFDITEFLHPGENSIAVRVMQWCDGTYVEGQDMWRMSGLFRSVKLYSVPVVLISDYSAICTLDADNQNAHLSTLVQIENTTEEAIEGLCISISLISPSGVAVFPESIRRSFAKSIQKCSRYQIDFSLNIRFPMLWTDETPELYTLIMELLDDTGTVLDVRAGKIGLREIKIINGVLNLNGRPLRLKGANRHEHDPYTGKVISEESMLKDIRLLKAFNFNAVRASHYPNCNRWYELCDQYGIYVMDEANLECNEIKNPSTAEPYRGAKTEGQIDPSKDIRFLNTYLERCSRMVLRDKNHPCVIMWSLGNESGWGSNFAACAGWIHDADPSRPIHYEEAIRESKIPDCIDILSLMYPKLEYIHRVLNEPTENRPLLLMEYAHSKGNSTGMMEEYETLFRRYPRLAGGFVWDWKDMALLIDRDTPKQRYAYGGDFDEGKSDGNNCLCGILWPDQTPKSGAYACKKIGEPIEFLFNGRTITVTSLEGQGVLNRYRYHWQLLRDGKIFLEGSLQDLRPDDTERLCWPLPEEIKCYDIPGEYILTLRANRKKATALLSEGHEVAWAQFILGHTPFPIVHTKYVPLRVIQTETTYSAISDLAALAIDKTTGRITRLSYNGTTVMTAGPRLGVWRAPNDSLPQKETKTRWLSQQLDRLHHEMTGFDVLTNSHGILIEVCTHVSGFNCGFDCTYRYEFSGNGILSVTLEAVPFGVPMDLPRFGLDIILPETMEKHCWYGRGPFENYVDRCAAAPLGRYKSTVTEQYVPHIIPQACGNKTGVRWATFSDDQGHGLQIKSSSHFECSALHYTAEDLSSARHCWELQPRPEIYCTLDWMQRGVGEGGCGVDTLDQYRLRRLPQSIHFIFSPL